MYDGQNMQSIEQRIQNKQANDFHTNQDIWNPQMKDLSWV